VVYYNNTQAYSQRSCFKVCARKQENPLERPL